MDIIANLSQYPQPDEKIRANQTIICGGGNAGNTAIALTRLGIDTTLITKFGSDSYAISLQNEFTNERIHLNLSFTCQSISPLTYIMVALVPSSSSFHESTGISQQHTRTCIHSPMNDEITLIEVETLKQNLSLSSHDYHFIHYDSRHTQSACSLASFLRNYPHIIQSIDLEKPRPYLEELLKDIQLIFTNEIALQKFFLNSASAEGEAVPLLKEQKNPEELMLNFFSSSSSSLTPNCLLVICTLGERGSLLLCPKDSPFLLPSCEASSSTKQSWLPNLASRVPITTTQMYESNFYLIRSFFFYLSLPLT